MNRWLLLTQDFPPRFVGGIASWAEDLSLALTEQGEHTIVFARRTGDTTGFDRPFAASVHRCPGRSWSRWQGLWMRLAVGHRLTSHDRVIAATWRLATQLLGPIERSGARLAVAFHGSDLTRLETAPPALQRVVSSAHALLPVSRFLADELQRLDLIKPGDPRLHVLPMPVRTLQPSPTGTGLICVARQTPLKGIDRAVALAQALSIPITLVGADAPTGPLIHPLGQQTREETRAAIARSAAIVLLPRVDPQGRGAEGLGLALIEAATMGVPGIGCATGGVPEAIGPGLIVSDPDKPDLDGIRTFLADASAGQRARTWALDNHGAQHAVSTLQEALPCV